MADVRESLAMAATADAVYDLVADLPRMGEWSPECERVAWRGGATCAAKGAQFLGFHRAGSSPPSAVATWLSRSASVCWASPVGSTSSFPMTPILPPAPSSRSGPTGDRAGTPDPSTRRSALAPRPTATASKRPWPTSSSLLKPACTSDCWAGRSGRVAGVQAHIVLGEVTSIHGPGAVRDAELDPDPDLIQAQVGPNCRQCGAVRLVGVDLDPAEGDAHPLGLDVKVVLALADSHRDPPPVRVTTVHHRLDQRRVDDRLAHPFGL